ncbi:MAG TPA: hypothetical protein VMV09_02335 [Candidatus Saccharimonadales bacterium]|nr:hypothetical protein [Candidatus Saccharimonadales bacterium]
MLVTCVTVTVKVSPGIVFAKFEHMMSEQALTAAAGRISHPG